MQRNPEDKAEFRTDVAWRIHDIINRRTCLHVDAWLFQDDKDVLYFVIERRRAGKQLVSTRITRAEPSGLHLVSEDWRDAEYMRHKMLQRHINTRWATKNAPWLERLHRDHILPHLRVPRDGFKGYVSVRLHYVYLWPTLDPFEGLPNYYGDSEPRDVKGVRERPEEPWDVRQRSILRTLQKLLD